MGGPTFRLDQVKGLDPDFDPYGILSEGLRPPEGIQRNSVYADYRLRLNDFDGNPENVSFHFHRIARAEALRKDIVRVAKEEWNYWQQDYGRGKPTEDDGREGSNRVRKYWGVVGRGYRTRAELRKHPWSAAFVSYVMKMAGAFPDFKRAQKHTYYFYHAKQARRELYGSLFKAYPATGAGAVKPDVGDVIANERAGNPISYDNMKPWGVSHSDIVVRKSDGVIVVVGGNVSAGKGKGNKVVGKKYIALDSNGYLQSLEYLRPDGTFSKNPPKYWSVMKIEARTSKLLRPGEKR